MEKAVLFPASMKFFKKVRAASQSSSKSSASHSSSALTALSHSTSTTTNDEDGEFDMSYYECVETDRVIMSPKEVKVVFVRGRQQSNSDSYLDSSALPAELCSPTPCSPRNRDADMCQDQDSFLESDNEQISSISDSSEIELDKSVLPKYQQLAESGYGDSFHDELVREASDLQSQVMEVEQKLSANNVCISDMRQEFDELFHEFKCWGTRHDIHHQSIIALSKDLSLMTSGMGKLKSLLETDRVEVGTVQKKTPNESRDRSDIVSSSEPDAQVLTLDGIASSM